VGAAPLPLRRCPASFIGWSCRGILRPRILSCLVSRLLGNYYSLLFRIARLSILLLSAHNVNDVDIMPDLLRCEWWSDGDSNPGHPACKAGALPTELPPQHKALARFVGGGRTGTRTWDLHLIRMAL
jgi:hypothetical protein